MSIGKVNTNYKIFKCGEKNMKKILLTIVFILLLGFAAFADQADDVSYNLSKQISNTDTILEYQRKMDDYNKVSHTYTYQFAHGDYKKVKFGNGTKTNLDGTRVPIEWWVLAKENGKALLLSVKNFRNEYAPKDYQNSEVRNELNDYYYNNFFTEEERSCILDAENTNKHYNKFDIKIGSSDIAVKSVTTDKLFLLSIDEMFKYTCSEENRKFNNLGNKNRNIFENTKFFEDAYAYFPECSLLRDTFSFPNNSGIHCFDCNESYLYDGGSATGAVHPAMWVKYDVSDVREKAKKQVPEMHAAGCSNEVKEISDEEMDALLKKFGIK